MGSDVSEKPLAQRGGLLHRSAVAGALHPPQRAGSEHRAEDLGPAATLAARRAVDGGRPGRALEIFLRDIVGTPPSTAAMARVLALSPRFRQHLMPGQIADQEALERLGDRLTAYAGINQPVLVVAGSASPEHLPRRGEILPPVLPSNAPPWM